MNNLSNIYLMTDVDGTLLNDNHKISARNLEAIKELRNCGGKFTIATGRGVSMAENIAEELELDEPAVIFNGAAVYDFKSKKFLWNSELSENTLDYLKQIHLEFPTVAIEVLYADKVFVPAINELERAHLKLGNVTPVICGFDEIPKTGYFKSLLVDTPENIDKIIDYTAKHCNDGVNWVRSSPIYYEMLPSGVNKGACFKKLLELTEESGRYVVTMGDYMNDIEMLKMADLGVAVENARDCVKEAADLIAADNNSDAIYEVIKYIKSKRF